MRTSALFGAKTFEFFEIYGVSARTRDGLLSVDIFRTRKKGGQFFTLCADVFYGRPLISFAQKMFARGSRCISSSYQRCARFGVQESTLAGVCVFQQKPE